MLYAMEIFLDRLMLIYTIISKPIAEDGNKTRRGWQLAAPRIIQRRMQHDSTLFEGALPAPLPRVDPARWFPLENRERKKEREKKKKRKENRKRKGRLRRVRSRSLPVSHLADAT